MADSRKLVYAKYLEKADSWKLFLCDLNVIFFTSRKLVVAKINPLKVFVISFFRKFKELIIVLDDVPGENRKTFKIPDADIELDIVDALIGRTSIVLRAITLAHFLSRWMVQNLKMRKYNKSLDLSVLPPSRSVIWLHCLWAKYAAGVRKDPTHKIQKYCTWNPK